MDVQFELNGASFVWNADKARRNARPRTTSEPPMTPEPLKGRLKKERPTISITLRVPVDVVESLKTLASLKGLNGHQALLKAYVSEGLRRDEAAHLFGPAARLAKALRKRGVPKQVIKAAAREAA